MIRSHNISTHGSVRTFSKIHSILKKITTRDGQSSLKIYLSKSIVTYSKHIQEKLKVKIDVFA